jgi:hypothetical protein
MHGRGNILQYVKSPFGRWQWEPISKNHRTGNLIWSKARSDQSYIVWREKQRRHYQKVGHTPSEALKVKRRKEFELAGRAVLQDRKPIPQPKGGGFTVEAAVADFLDFTNNKKRPNTYKRYRAVLDHFRPFAKPFTQVGAISPADIDAYRDGRLAEKNGKGKPTSPRNVDYEVATIRSFYYYLQKSRDPTLPNPAARLKPLAVTGQETSSLRRYGPRSGGRISQPGYPSCGPLRGVSPC